MTEPQSRRGAETKRQKTRRKIMHAAKGLFEVRGIENVSFADIAEEADICRTTVFNHFASTDALQAALFEEEIADIEEYCRQKGGRGKDFIATLFDKLIEDTANYPVLAFRLAASSVLQGPGAEAAEAVRQTEETRPAEETAQKNGALTRIEAMIMEQLPEPDLLRALTVMGAYYGLVNHYHAQHKYFDAEQMKREFHQMLDMLIQ